MDYYSDIRAKRGVPPRDISGIILSDFFIVIFEIGPSFSSIVLSSLYTYYLLLLLLSPLWAKYFKNKHDGKECPEMNRVVIITGSTRGIGLFTAAEFLRDDDRVVIFCRHEKHVSEATENLSRLVDTKNLLGLTGDVREQEGVKKVVDKCRKHFGRIDILINNAGVAVYRPIEKTSETQWDRIIDTNLKGTFLFLRNVLPVMKKQRIGVIINISSGLGMEGMAGFSAYCTSKFGVVGLTKSLADEVSEPGIRIYAVLPGAVNTKMIADSGLEIDSATVLQPEYVAKRIFEAAMGNKQSGALIEVYS
jgi:3-oxoacyl-[acyl-carrier protein] reductase